MDRPPTVLARMAEMAAMIELSMGQSYSFKVVCTAEPFSSMVKDISR